MYVTQTITEKRIEWNSTQKYGNFRTYWKLYAKLLAMISDRSEMVIQLRKQISQLEGLTGVELRRRVDRRFRVLRFGAYTWTFVWVCLIKPLGQFFSKNTTIKGSFRVVNGEFINKDLTKCTSYLFLGITIWFVTTSEFTPAEIEELIK